MEEEKKKKERNIRGIPRVEISMKSTADPWEAGERRQNGSCHVRDIHQRRLFQRSKRTCSISTLFLNPFWLSSDARTRADTWLDNCAHWCLPIDNPWKIYRTGCGQGSTAGDHFNDDCFHCLKLSWSPMLVSEAKTNEFSHPWFF